MNEGFLRYLRSPFIGQVLHCKSEGSALVALVEQGKILFRHFELGPVKQIETVSTVVGPKFTPFYF